MRKLGFLVALPVVGALFAVTPAAAQPTPEVTAFCEAGLAADKALAKLETGGKPKRSDAQALEAALSQVGATTPPQIATQVQAVVAATRTAVQRGRDPFQVDPDFGQNFNTIQQYRYDSCGYTQLDVTGIEYEFQGLPETVSPGPVAIRFTDTGAELHELVIFRLKGKESLRKLLGLSDKEQERKVEFVGATEAIQNETTYTIADMSTPGRYGVACFLPVGSTSKKKAEEAEHEHGGGTPHWKKGMRATITVQAS